MVNKKADYWHEEYLKLRSENIKLKSTLKLHSGEVCSLNNEVEQFRTRLEEVQAENERLKKANL